MTDLSPREKELVEAARRFWTKLALAPCATPRQAIQKGFVDESMDALSNALRAYDPPKREYTMPTWREYVKLVPEQPEKIEAQEGYGLTFVGHGKWFIWREQYETIRNATSKEVKP